MIAIVARILYAVAGGTVALLVSLHALAPDTERGDIGGRHGGRLALASHARHRSDACDASTAAAARSPGTGSAGSGSLALVVESDSKNENESETGNDADAPVSTMPAAFMRDAELRAVDAALKELGRPGELAAVDCDSFPCVIYATTTAPRLDWRDLMKTKAMAPYRERNVFVGGQMIVDRDYKEIGDETFAVAFIPPPSASVPTLTAADRERLLDRMHKGLDHYDPR